jgi:hypothetical protein
MAPAGGAASTAGYEIRRISSYHPPLSPPGTRANPRKALLSGCALLWAASPLLVMRQVPALAGGYRHVLLNLLPQLAVRQDIVIRRWLGRVHSLVDRRSSILVLAYPVGYERAVDRTGKAVGATGEAEAQPDEPLEHGQAGILFAAQFPKHGEQEREEEYWQPGAGNEMVGVEDSGFHGLDGCLLLFEERLEHGCSGVRFDFATVECMVDSSSECCVLGVRRVVFVGRIAQCICASYGHSGVVVGDRRNCAVA